MKNRSYKITSFSVFILLFVNSILFPQIGNFEKKSFHQQAVYSSQDAFEENVIDISNITSWVKSNGFHNWLVAKDSWNGSYPNGKNAGVIFTEGIEWGGLVYDGGDTKVRVNGNNYSSGCKAITRLYRIRTDYRTADLTRDAANFFRKAVEDVTKDDIRKLREQYEKDWNEWPVEDGAIFNDIDNDGIYNSSVDVPGVPGATQTIFIKYNDSESLFTYKSPAIGLEITETYWAYSNTGAFNNAVFKKVNIVYKGTGTSQANSFIDSMYICQWSDVDLGNGTDDLAGCDTTLNLGYVYNYNNDKIFSDLGMAPPAVGYVILQGVAKYTGNEDDSAIVNLKWRKGYKYVNRKPLSTFINSATAGSFSDPDYSYRGTLQLYNYMRGKMPIPEYPKGVDFSDNIAVTTTHGTYFNPGDPITETGIVDNFPSVRRIWLMTGPFSMHLNDTVETVIALVVGQGNSSLNSIAKLKENTRNIKTQFNSLVLQVPSIKSPAVEVVPLHNEVVLRWGNNSKEINAVENFSKGNYNFEGYEIYQLPSKDASVKEGVKIAVHDLKNGITSVYDTLKNIDWVDIPQLQVRGKDKGIKRFISVKRDTLNGTSLIDGHTYYFGVVSYAVNISSAISSHIIRSPMYVVEAVPQTENPGVRYNSNSGDTLVCVHVAGKGNGKVLPIVIDPTKTDGKTYQIIFDTLENNIIWNLKEKESGTILLSNQSNQTGDNNYPIVNGIMPKVFSPSKGINKLKITGNRWISGENWGGSNFYGSTDIAQNFWNIAKPIYNYFPVELRFTGGDGKETPNEENGWSKGAVYRKDKNYTYSGIGWMPFTAWDISDSLNPRRINISFVEDSINGNINLKWDMGWNGNLFKPHGGNEYIVINNTDYNPEFYNNINNALKSNAMYVIWPKRRGEHPYLESTFSIKIFPNIINMPGDIYEYRSPHVIVDKTLAQIDVEKIKVFPNPYYTYEETDNVTFNHLPDNAVIRIFDLSGVLVKTIKHEGKFNQFEKWDLKNEKNHFVASGIYVVQIDMPEINKTKTLKLAIITKR